MRRRHVWTMAIVALLGVGLSLPLRSRAMTPQDTATALPEALSVMTYNVKGLPWPVAWGRDSALDAIGDRLGELRRDGRQPHIVLLQEAFTGEAQAIGRAGGYRYAVDGPSAVMPGDAVMTGQDRAFAAAARWSKGETQGKLVDSGLRIFSDYPIVRVRRAAFPTFACAGYDCLANKGVLLASILVPGADVPVEILTTHLNSCRSSGVSFARSLYAYRRQVDFLEHFVAANHDPASPLIVAGDFNMGPRPARQAMLTSAVRSWSSEGGRRVLRDGFSPFVNHPAGALAASPDARWIVQRARDWQFLSDGTAASLTASRAVVLFGRDPDGAMLSDHMGFAVGYHLKRV